MLDAPASSSETLPAHLERWRKQLPVQPRSLPTSGDSTPQYPRVVIPSPTRTRRRSTGQQSPSPTPTTTLPANSRADPTAPRDITSWRQGVPLGAQPEGVRPWASPLGDDDDSSRDVEDLSEQPDITSPLSSTAPTSLPPSSPDAPIHQWRYENYVDWWRGGLSAPHEVVSPPPQIGEIGSSSVSDQGEHPQGSPVPTRVTLDRDDRPPPVFSPPPPPLPSPPLHPEPQVIRIVDMPPVQVSPIRVKPPTPLAPSLRKGEHEISPETMGV